MKRGFCAALFACLMTLITAPTRADDALATLHYYDLLDIRHSVSYLQDLKRLRFDMYVSSVRPGVPPGSIRLAMHRVSGMLVDIPVDAAGRFDLPELPGLMQENPLITTNQPKHSLKVTVIVDLAPLTKTKTTYADLMLGVTQFNQGMDRDGAMQGMFNSKADGMLLFYPGGNHSLTLTGRKFKKVIASETVAQAAAHLRSVQLMGLNGKVSIIYVPLDKKWLKQNPQAVLDSLPGSVIPSI